MRSRMAPTLMGSSFSEISLKYRQSFVIPDRGPIASDNPSRASTPDIMADTKKDIRPWTSYIWSVPHPLPFIENISANYSNQGYLE